MNKKIISQKEASEQLKQYEVRQRALKALRDYNFKFNKTKEASKYQKIINENKEKINFLLSIIYWHKTAKKMFSLLKKKNP
jgi:hypothetical protein